MSLPIREFIKRRLLEFDPTFDTGDGLATTTFLIDPLTLILQPLRNEIDQVLLNQSIMSVLESSNPDLFPEDVVDALVSNFVVTRNQGNTTQVTVRIRFFEPQDFTAGTGLLTALGSSGQRFINKSPVSITAAEMSLNREGTLFFVDVIFIASEVGERFNILAGDIQALENAPAGVVSVVNLSDSDKSGRNKETNTELIDRAKVAITVRALVTGRGIISLLTENFSFIKEIQPIGLGDPEMMRDIRFATHIGGNVDVYIKTPVPIIAEQDFIGLLVDTTRLLSSAPSLVAKSPSPTSYSVGQVSINESVNPFVAKAFDGFVTFTRNTAYTFDNTSGLFMRLNTAGDASTPGHMYHKDILAAQGGISDINHLTDSGLTMGFARPGMIVTILSPASVAGSYQIAPGGVAAGSIKILGSLPVFPLAGVTFQIDEHVKFTFDYNPVSIDVIKPARSGHENFTLESIPELYIDQIERLDPVTSEPTGEVLDPQSGFGSGGFGSGGFGVGVPGDYKYIVNIPNQRFSAKEDNLISFAPSQLGSSVRVNYRHASQIQEVQTFMDDPLNRSETASLLAKHHIPIFVSTTKTITYRVPAGATVADEATVLQLVLDLIENLKAQSNLEKSDIVDLLYDQGATQVDLDWKLVGEIQHEDGSTESITEDAQGVLTPPSPTIPKITDKPFSPRIGHFSALNISLTRVTI